jgi:hypothetical protein
MNNLQMHGEPVFTLLAKKYSVKASKNYRTIFAFQMDEINIQSYKLMCSVE